jgi:hypothetical protein
MKKWITSLAILILVVGYIGCAGGNSNNTTQAGAQSAMATINFGDATNDQIVFFEMTATTITLNGGSNPSVLPHPTEFEFTHTGGTVEPLSVLNIPAGTYTGASISLSNPELVVIDPLTGLPKRVNATLSSSTVNVTFPSPITVNGATTVLNFDLNLATSITIDPSNTTATVNPQFTVTTSTATASGENEDERDGRFDDVRGVITNITAPKFTITNPHMAQPLVITTDSNTQYKDGLTGFNSLAVNMVVSIDVVTQSDGTVLAKEIEADAESVFGEAAEGVITAVNCASAVGCPASGNPATSLNLLVHRAVATNPANVPVPGSNINISLASGTRYVVINRFLTGLFPPFDATHISAAQRIEAIAFNQTGNTATSIVADKIKLKEQALTGTVSNASGSTFTLTVGANSYFAKLTGTTTLTVQILGGTEMRNVTISNGATVRVRGLLFVNSGAYTMWAARIGNP